MRDRAASSNESGQPDEQLQELPAILRAPVAPSDEGEQPGEQAVEPPIILRGEPHPPPDDEQPEEAPPDIPNIFRDPEALSPGGAPDKTIVWSPQADETWEESA